MEKTYTRTITEFANKCLHEMNFGELSTTECIAKYLNLWHKEKMRESVNQPLPIDDISQHLLSFFLWFRENGERHVDKSIEAMIDIYLKEGTKLNIRS